ncbi:unnamed protein product [Rodentolepis nana]|uniref:RIB43A-like with coiled-coils protein 2 n=1 Tax=Rodentolepis nana TaxID=102285 RepID=A0A0R3TQG5_RODNA|nr:unnamed protein product [Rodentolepis nana]
MYKLDLPLDKKEHAAIERRRLFEKQRMARIFNEKIRRIGVDERAIAQQVKEKLEREESERLRELAFAKEAERNDKLALLMEKRQTEEHRMLNRAINEYRLQHQKPTSRREFDLNDPDALKKELPARISDDDSRCGASSLQKFVGEDLTKKARDKLQQQQMSAWFDKQIEEHNRADASRKYDENLEAIYRREIEARTMALAQAEANCRRAVQCAVRRYNEAMAAEREQKEREERRLEEETGMQEILNAINSDFLNENPAQARSALGPNRAREEEEKKLNNLHDEQLIKSSKRYLLIEKEYERILRERRRQIQQENMLLAEDQKTFQKYLNEEVYKYQPTSEFFTQFNTTSR